MRRMSPREAQRMMKKMGMSVENVEGPAEVTIRTPSREIVVQGADVSLTRMQGQTIYQVMGGKVTERAPAAEEAGVSRGPVVAEEDVQLVAQQASVSVEAARKALEETGGDLAQAILLLAQRRAG